MNILRTGILLAGLTGLFLAVGYLLGGQSGMLIALAVSVATNFFCLLEFRQDGACACMARARSAAPPRRNSTTSSPSLRSAPICRCPRSISWTIRSPTPLRRAAILQNAAVAATTGLLQSLSRDEIAGVMAHELAHVKNRDTLIMTITATIAGAISMLANFAGCFGGRDRNNGDGRSSATIAMLMILAPIAAMIVQMAISRTREYSADRLGAEISGQPRSLASALSKIAGAAHHVENRTAEANPATAPYVHHQSLVGRAHGQSVFHPSRHREPHRRPDGDGAGDGRREPAWRTTGPWAKAGGPSPLGRPMGLERDADGLAARRAALDLLDGVLRDAPPAR